MADTTAVIKYYQDLLLSQWVNATKARGTIGVLADCAVTDLVSHDVRDAFDLDTAIGAQLDGIGEYIGMGRNIYGQIVRPYMALDTYTAADSELYGLTDYTDPNISPVSVMWRYEFDAAAFYTLEDEEYRSLLKLKRALNFSDNTLYAIQALLTQFLGTDVTIYDTQDMRIGYYIKNSASRIAGFAASQGLLPRPMGVDIVGVFSVPYPTAVFGFQRYVGTNDNTKGFGSYVPLTAGNHFLSALDAI